MTKVSKEAMEKFNERMWMGAKRIGKGKVEVDGTALHALVHEEPEVATLFVEIYCMQALSNPRYFQNAMTIANIYSIEFGDQSLMLKVRERVKASGAEDLLEQELISIDLELEPEPPERIAAKEWWKITERQDVRCDKCSRPMVRGEGYMVHGPLYKIVSLTIDTGDCLICEECFTKTRGGKVWL